MKRIVSVWLPLWPIERLRRTAARPGQPPGAMADDQPLALVETGSRGICITAVNERAAREGVRVGTPLADARAALPALLSRPAEPARDRAALLGLARWSGRYGPARNIDGADGLWIAITGVAHLFGGESALLADLAGRLARFGVTARLGLADTPGAAHALARFGPMPDQPWAIAPAGETRAALAPLPVESLRLEPATVLLLKRLGLRRIGQLYDLPRGSLERRFRSAAVAKSTAAASAKTTHAVLARLDCALGSRDEPRRALGEPPVLAARRLFAEPLISPEALAAETARLAGELSLSLTHQGLGCRRIRLSLYRADGTLAEVMAGLSAPSRDPRHLLTLLREKLADIDAGFGIDGLVLAALAAERFEDRQTAFGSDFAAVPEARKQAVPEARKQAVPEARKQAVPEARKQHAVPVPPEAGKPQVPPEARLRHDAAALADQVVNRLGGPRVFYLEPHASHRPERAQRRLSALEFVYAPPWPYARGPLRPPFLLANPENIAVMAEVPEGAPASFTWRRVTYRVARAEGPERIASEWWRLLSAPAVAGAHPRTAADSLGDLVAKPPANRPRDYYRVEDDAGGAYWVFREGLYQATSEDGPPGWFMHGLFG